MQLLTFILNQIHFGIPTEEVEYIADGMTNVETSLSEKYIRGTVILGGEVIPLYDLNARFELKGMPKRNKIIVVKCDNRRVGLEVDNIKGIITLENKDCEDILKIIQSENICVKYIVRDKEKLIQVLDVCKIVKGA